MDRREFLKFAMASGGAAYLGSSGVGPQRAHGQVVIEEPLPTSPLILSPFRDRLPTPNESPLPTSDPSTWRTPDGKAAAPQPNPAHHQDWSFMSGSGPSAYYNIKLVYKEHQFTTSKVRGRDGKPRNLPKSIMSVFNGTFPGPLIKASYGQPCLVRFNVELNPDDCDGDLNDFGIPSCVTHLHNGHTAPESDGNPFQTRGEGADGYDSWYVGGNGHWFYDNLYLNMPPAVNGVPDDREKQSFFWFHDHRMDNTGSNVYKGMVGLYYIYDPILDPGDETQGLQLPGVPKNDGSGGVLYDVPLALYDCRFDDGVTPHRGLNVGSSLDFGVTQDGQPHDSNWGKLFFAHYENHGFVGDVMTVNGIAYPYLPVKRRKYRLRFLDASISRWYDLKLMRGRPLLKPGLQGQYELTGSQQVMRWTQIATEGGLMPRPLVRDVVRLAPAKRREVIVDFSKYMDGSPTKKGDVIYLTNILEMKDGRKPTGQLKNGVPLMMFIIDGNPSQPDQSVIPATLRERPPVPPASYRRNLVHRRFLLERGGSGWQINGAPFDPDFSYANVPYGAEEVWEIVNGGGGWTHPLHIHQEEHAVVSRNGRTPPADDNGKEDVIALAEGESVQIYRKFRTFRGRYVAHCHNLAHEDHAMMFGWQIV